MTLTYPALVAAVEDVDDLATAAGVDADAIRDLLAGGWAAPFSIRDRLARALGANPVDLFRLVDELEDALAGAPTRYVTDPATLRTIDRPR